MSIVDPEKIDHYKAIGVNSKIVDTVIEWMFRAEFSEKCIGIYDLIKKGRVNDAWKQFDEMEENLERMKYKIKGKGKSFQMMILDVETSIGLAKRLFTSNIEVASILCSIRHDTSLFYLEATDAKIENKNCDYIVHKFDKRILLASKRIGMTNMTDQIREVLLEALQMMFTMRETIVWE